MDSKCQALAGDGKQCRNKAKGLYHYFGDSELYDSYNGKPSWVSVTLCSSHVGSTDKTIAEHHKEDRKRKKQKS